MMGNEIEVAIEQALNDLQWLGNTFPAVAYLTRPLRDEVAKLLDGDGACPEMADTLVFYGDVGAENIISGAPEEDALVGRYCIRHTGPNLPKVNGFHVNATLRPLNPEAGFRCEHGKQSPVPVGTLVDYHGSLGNVGRYVVTAHTAPRPGTPDPELHYPDGVGYELWPEDMEPRFGNREHSMSFVRRGSITPVEATS